MTSGEPLPALASPSLVGLQLLPCSMPCWVPVVAHARPESAKA